MDKQDLLTYQDTVLPLTQENRSVHELRVMVGKIPNWEIIIEIGHLSNPI